MSVNRFGSKFAVSASDLIITPPSADKYVGQARDSRGRWTSSGAGQTPESIKSKSLKTIDDINKRIGAGGQLAVATGQGTTVLHSVDPNGDPEEIAGQLTNEWYVDQVAKTYEAQGMNYSDATKLAYADVGRAQMYYYTLAEKQLAAGFDSPEYKTNLATSKKDLSNLVQNGDITVAVNSQTFEKVVADGRFKNQFETKTSGGWNSVNDRQRWEAASQDVPFDVKNSERPVYGYLTNNTSSESGTGWAEIGSINNKGVNQYGDLRVVMKDSVRNRATYTVGDSLSREAFAFSVDAPISDSILDHNGFWTYGAPGHTSGSPIAGYVETQIRGGLKISDIAKVYAPSMKVEAVQSLLKDNGLDIPVEAKE